MTNDAACLMLVAAVMAALMAFPLYHLGKAVGRKLGKHNSK
jgi:hypothetical protein